MEAIDNCLTNLVSLFFRSCYKVIKGVFKSAIIKEWGINEVNLLRVSELNNETIYHIDRALHLMCHKCFFYLWSSIRMDRSYLSWNFIRVKVMEATNHFEKKYYCWVNYSLILKNI